MNRTASIVLVAVMVLSIGAALRADPPAATAPEVVKILDRYEAAGAKVTSLRSKKMTYQRNQTDADEITDIEGAVLYLKLTDSAKPAGQQARTFFRVDFNKEIKDKTVSNKKVIYSIYDGWLHELNEKTVQLVNRQLVPPGQAINPFKLGEGPFPLPFGQTKKDVLDNFDVKLIPADAKDPKESDHLEMTPKAAATFAKKYKKIHFYVSQKSNLPEKMVTEAEGEIVTAGFADLEINPKLAEGDFALTKPREFQEVTIPLNKP